MPIDNANVIENNFPILEEIPNVFLNIIKAYHFASLDWRKVQQSTREDKTLCKVIKFCMDGCQEREPENDDIKIFDEYNFVLWGHRVVVPEKLRKLDLRELHFSHFGITKMKALAFRFVWWPHLDEDLQNITKSCLACMQKKKKNPLKIPLRPRETQISIYFKSTFKRLFRKRRTSSAPYT